MAEGEAAEAEVWARLAEPGSLLPAVVQDAVSGDVLMVAWVSGEALARTLRDRQAWFYSRSREALWRKGETSGHTMEVVEVRYDCDADALLYRVLARGPACHTGRQSCFYRSLSLPESWPAATVVERGGKHGEAGAGSAGILAELEEVVRERQRSPRADSYTSRLLAEGRRQIAQRLGEEAVEVALAGVAEGDERLVSEVADLMYHATVLLAERGLGWRQVWEELAARRR